MNLSDDGEVHATTIVVKARRYNDNAATISVNGQTSQNVTGTSLENYSFTINDDITYLQLNSNKYVWVAEVTVNFSSTEPEVNVASTTINVPFNETVGTLGVNYENITTVVAGVMLCNKAGTSDSTYTWINAEINDDDIVSYTIYANEGSARTAYFKVYALDNDSNDVYSDLVTVTQAAYSAVPAGGGWALVSSIYDLMVGGAYVIACNSYERVAGDISSQLMSCYDATFNSDKSRITSLPNEAICFTLDTVKSGDDIYYTFENGSGQLLGCSAVKKMEWGGDHTQWDLTFNGSVLTMQNVTTSVGALQYNYNSGNDRFTTYTSNQTPIQLYRQIAASNFSEEIEGYGAAVTGKWYLVASPLTGFVRAGDVANLKNNEYDLYRFNQNADKEWENYKANTFFIESGRGYLYANKGDVTLTFTGTPYSGDSTVALVYAAGKDFEGWNLIGNPLAATAGATLNKAFYKMNGEGTGFEAQTEGSVVALMEGVFVQATAVNQTAKFTAVGSSETRGDDRKGIAKVNFMVSGTRGTVIDNAIVRFDNGEALEKFMLNPTNTRVYFTQNGKDYAIVDAEAQGELLVNFIAAENGRFTISVEVENLNASYLHLIDNKTGNDVDLLANPIYTFDARKSDYASRFRLVFNTNGVNEEGEENEDFAFVCNDAIIVTNEGGAVLQVVDMLGRIVSAKSISGNAAIDKMNANGVYVLRLIQGDNVKTQKIVVR